MIAGVFCALLACCIWGLIFVIPEFMTGFSAFEVALGRHFVYGFISSLIFINIMRKGFFYPSYMWRKAFVFSLVSNIGYYTFLVLSFRYCNPAMSAMVLGTAPILMAFYGNFLRKEVSFTSLLFPSLLIFIGLILMNIPSLKQHENPSSYFLGLLFSAFSLLCWCWYAVANANFLKKHPTLPAIHWSTLMGTTTLVLVLFFAITLGLLFKEQMDWGKYLTPQIIPFAIGSLILGGICSLCGSFLWNKASLYLPVTLAGQLLIFETLFGALFFYLLKGTLPPTLEWGGALIMLFSVAYAMRSIYGRSTPKLEK